VRIVHTGDADPSNDAADTTTVIGGLDLTAANAGAWGNKLKAIVDHNTKDTADNQLFNLTIQELASTDPTDDVVASEVFRNVSTDPASPRYVKSVLDNQSTLVLVGTSIPEFQPSIGEEMFTGGDDGEALEFADYEVSPEQRTGIYALDKADLFTLMCIPPFTHDTPGDVSTWTAALASCKGRRAMLIVDPDPNWNNPDAVVSDSQNSIGLFTLRDENSILYYPRVRMAAPLQENRLQEFAPCGVVAGVFSRTDASRGVWKAPAGLAANLLGVRELSYKMTDGENGKINPIGVNALRTFAVVGNVVWGARTLDSADQLASEWKYIPVRRLALFIEESLYRGPQ
jgi:hypothetical protein